MSLEVFQAVVAGDPALQDFIDSITACAYFVRRPQNAGEGSPALTRAQSRRLAVESLSSRNPSSQDLSLDTAATRSTFTSESASLPGSRAVSHHPSAESSPPGSPTGASPMSPTAVSVSGKSPGDTSRRRRPGIGLKELGALKDKDKDRDREKDREKEGRDNTDLASAGALFRKEASCTAISELYGIKRKGNSTGGSPTGTSASSSTNTSASSSTNTSSNNIIPPASLPTPKQQQQQQHNGPMPSPRDAAKTYPSSPTSPTSPASPASPSKNRPAAMASSPSAPAHLAPPWRGRGGGSSTDLNAPGRR